MPRVLSRTTRLLLALLAIAAAAARAQDAPAPSAPSAPPAAAAAASSPASAPEAGPGLELSPEVEQVLEDTRRTVRSSTEWLARGVDGLFGDRPFSDGGKVSDGELSPGVLVRQGEKAQWTLRFNARVRLPNIERRAYLFVGRDDARDVATDAPGVFNRQQQMLQEGNADNAFFAGLGLRLLDDAVQLRAGLRSGAHPYVQARYAHDWRLSPESLADFRETVFWTHDDQLGSTTALSLEHALRNDLAVRLLGATTITQRTDRFEHHASAGLYQDFGAQRVGGLEALYANVMPSGVFVNNYGLQVRWQQPLHRDWLLGEVLLGRFLAPEAPPGERTAAWAVGGRLTLRF